MATFYDSFDRANGPLGANWTTTTGTPAISGNAVSYTNPCSATCTAASDSGRQEALAHIVMGTGNTQYGGVGLKCNTGNANGIWARVVRGATNFTFELRAGLPAGGSLLASADLGTTYNPMAEIHLWGENGDYHATLDGAHQLDGTTSAYLTETYQGICNYSSNFAVLDFQAVGGSAPGLIVTPSPIGNYGVTVPVTFAGTNTAWTPGTPGSPTFTVDHGTLSAQVVDSATAAHATYDPGLYLGPATFSDPSTGATYTVTVTSNPTTVNPSGLALSQAAIDYIERSAAAEVSSVIVNRNEVITVGAISKTVTETITENYDTLHDTTPPDNGIGSLLALIVQCYDLLNGGSNWGGVATVLGNTSLIKSDTDSLLDRLDLSVTNGNYATGSLLRSLAGLGTTTLADLLTAISGISIDPSSIIDAINALQGAGGYTIADVIQTVLENRGTGGYDHTDIMGAISAARGTNSPSIHDVMAKLALIQTGTLPDLLTIDQHISTMAAVADAISLVTGSNAGRVAAITAGADDLYDLASRAANRTIQGGAPVWPGASAATLGTARALSNGLTITEAMHGVIVTITQAPGSNTPYIFGTVPSYQHAGALIFGDGAGRWERPESIGLATQILCPKSMAQAGACIVRTYTGFTGTVQPWTIT